MFPFRRRKLDNATLAPPAPIETTIYHNYSSSRIGTILALFTVAVASAILFWHGLVFVLAEVGFNEPDWAAAVCLLSMAALFTLLTALGVAARYVLKDFFAHRERMADKLVKLKEAEYKSVQLIPASTQARMTREEGRQYLAVKMVMARAFDEIDDKGNLIGKLEPWSRRQVGLMRLINEKEDIGENSNLAKWVKTYLLSRHILLNERRVNRDDFPNIATVEAQLVKDFGSPINYYGANDNAGMSTHYLDKGTGRESWG